MKGNAAMSAVLKNLETTATIHVYGDIAALDFPEWILRHADKLGLQAVRTQIGPNCLQVEATGPDEMLNALALGCSLGPETVLVERIEYITQER